MGPVMGSHWDVVMADLDYAFQPICNLHTGTCYGYEALVRGWERHFGSVHEMLDRAFVERQVFQLDLELRAAAIRKFALLPNHRSAKLFLNVDNRVIEMADYHTGETTRLLERFGLSAHTVCFEISERHRIASSGNALATVATYRDQHFQVALDDYGTGFSGLQMLYETRPDFVKVDRFFIGGASDDARKRVFVKHVVDMAHVLGIRVIAEGVETAEELQFCWEAGCDLAQGRFIQWPTLRVDELRESYPEIAEFSHRDWRAQATRLRSLPAEHLDPIGADERVEELLKRFKATDHPLQVVVVLENGEPLGIVTEQTMRPFTYSRYGWALLTGPNGLSIRELTTRAATCDAHAPIHDALGLFSTSADSGYGVLLTENGRYAGFLTAAVLLKAVHERDVAYARDSNPLTRLPGNLSISEYFRDALADRSKSRAFAYFDFDRFKPFNDVYGFRRGDRAIQMFGELLRTVGSEHGFFVGHIGGDDFVAGFELPANDVGRVIAIVEDLCERFTQAVVPLHSIDDRKRGYIAGTTRDGKPARFSLLGASAAVIELPAGSTMLAAEDSSSLMSAAKSRLKASGGRVLHERVAPFGAVISEKIVSAAVGQSGRRNITRPTTL